MDVRESASPMKEPQQMNGREKKKKIEREFRNANPARRWESVVRRVCFHNEHVSFAATNPDRERRGQVSGSSLVSKTRKPEAELPGTE